MGSGLNGAKLRVVLDAAPTGQILLPTKTQGGAGASPGLWDKAPLGLKLVPFGSGLNGANLRRICLNRNRNRKMVITN
jgi:hypothetical protein